MKKNNKKMKIDYIKFKAIQLAGLGCLFGLYPFGNIIRLSLIDVRKNFIVKKLECSRQDIAMNTKAWNYGIRLGLFYWLLIFSID